MPNPEDILKGLYIERDGYSRAGRKDRVAQVDAEIDRVEVADREPEEAAVTTPVVKPARRRKPRA